MKARALEKCLVGLLLAFLMLASSFPMRFLSVGPSSNLVFAAATAPLKLNWTVTVSNTDTVYGALAAKLIPGSIGEQIVLTGCSNSTADGNTPNTGDVTVLNGTNGQVIWQDSGYQMSTHNPFQIADLNNDGNLEIVVADWNQTIALDGNNGSLYWKSPAPSGNLLLQIADVDGNGYPEIFTAEGSGPYSGSDYVTEIDHNGSILRQAYTWHPCYGGLAIGDPNGDGRLVLYQGDRSPTFGVVPDDSYYGGGLGLRAFDAATLSPLWYYPVPLCSSSAPILADVDGTGKLDVIVGDQNNDGIVVLNATDGTVDTTSGKYRSDVIGTYMNMPCHSEPTVGYFDNSTHLELMDCSYSQPKIWDLVNWTSAGNLTDENGKPLICAEPPKVGNVTGGPYPDIIAPADSDNATNYKNPNQWGKVYIYEYDDGNDSNIFENKTTIGTYGIVQILPNLWAGPRAFSLVADVDGDGKNELIFTSANGTIYCYDTSVPSNPAINTQVQFYSTYNQGVAEPVPPPVPRGPVGRNELPLQGSMNQTLNPTLSIDALDYQNNLLNILFSTNASGVWQNIGSFTQVPAGVYSVATSNMNQLATAYYWNVSVTDGVAPPVSKSFTFTTYANKPTQGTPLLVSSDGSNSSGANIICSNMSTTDTQNVTNVYSYYQNGVPFANMQLTLDTATSNNVFAADTLFYDGFENDFINWNANGKTNWDINPTEKHSGSYSAHATGGDTVLTSNYLNTAGAEGITVSFWYRTHAVSSSVLLQFWDGSIYRNIFDLGNTQPQDTWQYYSVQTYDTRYLSPTFKLRFGASSLKTGQDVWIDDFSITVPPRTLDYSGYGNNGAVHGATWISQGVEGGAYSFNGVNDYIRVQDNPSLGGTGTWSQITVAFWIKPYGLAKGSSIIAKKAFSTSTGSYMIGFESSGSPSNTLFWGITNTNTGTWKETHDNSLTVLSPGTWHYVVCTYQSGPGLTIYIDGTQRANLPLIGNIAPGPYASSNSSIFGQPLFIGCDGTWNPTSWLNGSLDEVDIYPEALSQSQIAQNYADTKSGLSSNSTISSSQLNVGDNWSCIVTPNDGFGDGLPHASNTLKIVNSSATCFLNVISSHDTPSPSNGTSLYNIGSYVTCLVNSSVIENGISYTCTGWTGSGSVPAIGPGTSVAFTITQNSTITWNWIPTPHFSLSVQITGSGTTNATGTATYNYGTSVSVLATPSSGWVLSYWLLNGSNMSPINPYTLNLTQNYNLTAVFTLNTVWFNSSFENGFSDWDNVTISGNGIAAVTSALAHDGIYSALFTTSGGSSVARAYCYKNLPTGESTVYTLAYVYVNSSISLSSGSALWLIQYRDLTGNVVASFGFKNSGSGTYWACMYNGQNGFASSGPQAGNWYAVEAFFNKSSSGKTLTIFINGAEAVSLTAPPVDTSGANSVGRVCLGICYNDPGYTYNVYIDTVTVAPRYVQLNTANMSSINLVSSQNTNNTTNLGAIILSGTQYSLPNSTMIAPGSYNLTYVPQLGYSFVQWQTTGSITLSNSSAPSTTLTVSGNGTLTAIYNASSVWFYDDYESGDFRYWTGVPHPVGGGTATVSSAFPLTGNYSAVFTTSGGSSAARAYCYKNLPTGESTVYTLAYVYINGSSALNAWNALWAIQYRDSSGNVIASFGIKNNGTGTDWACMYNGQTAFASSGPQAGVWYAVEAFFNKSASGQTVSIYVNGQLVASLSVDTSSANNIGQVCVGICYNDPGYLFTMYVDNVSISSTLI